jgi:hypothetical protein
MAPRYIRDDFEAMEEFGRSSAGKIPPNPPLNRYTEFQLLSEGKTLGKKINLWNEGVAGLEGGRFGRSNMFELRGPDTAAMNLQITLSPPKILTPEGGASEALANSQRISGTYDNDDLETIVPDATILNGELRNFQYAPVIALLTWGVGGISSDDAEIDVSNGLNINITASFVRISALIDPWWPRLNPSNGRSAGAYEIGAFVGPGYVKPNNAKRTYDLGGIATPSQFVPFTTLSAGPNFGTSPIVPVPKYATRVSLIVGGDYGDFDNDPLETLGWQAQIVFFSSSTGQQAGLLSGLTGNTNPALWTTIVGSYLVTDNGVGGKSFEIPHGAMYAAVRHNNAFPIQPRMIFDLGI